jgi:hypothetical protein
VAVRPNPKGCIACGARRVESWKTGLICGRAEPVSSNPITSKTSILNTLACMLIHRGSSRPGSSRKEISLVKSECSRHEQSVESIL